ncbi:MAG: DnaD domain protein, partial [Oscillospiraceae bacterium]
SAESYINDMHSKKSAWYAVCAAMSIERRSPSPKELQLAHQWVSDWQYGRDILRRAYEECVDAISKFSMPYVKKILDGWHKSGVKTIEDLTKLEKPSKPIGKITHDIDMATKSMFE